MIKCKNCGYQSEYTGKNCPVCGSRPVIDKADVENTIRELERATNEKNLFKIHTCRHLLADSGEPESSREYAKFLEKGEHQLKDIDAAMNYYYQAACQFDPYSAYRFSRLVGRSSEENARFWLRFAALLGSIDSYPEVAELFSEEGKEDIAAYYSSLAAACDDTISIVNMAKRWNEGIGVPKNDSHAKWYLDKLSIPPINAIKLAYRLRSISSQEPPKLVFPNFYKYLKLLSDNAKALNFDTAYFYITSMLAKTGDINAEVNLGMLLFEGKGCEKNIKEAKLHLEAAISRGNFAAALYLGEEYLIGRNIDKNPTVAMSYYEKATSLGCSDAFERLGDLYRNGAEIQKDIAKAIELYDLAAAGGCASAAEKARELKSTREGFYLDAYRVINLKDKVTKTEAFSAFRAAAIATAMGEYRAASLLAKCYAYGFGTETDRASAFFWYKRAAESGDREANLYLGFCYSRSFGTNFSYKNAVRYLKIALDLGLCGAREELEILNKRKMKKMVRALYASSVELIHQKKYAEAAKLLSSFESLAYPKALYTLGCLYEFGRGVAKCDRARAEKYYERAYVGNTTFGSFKDPNSQYKLRILRMIR